jgi:hypothetical protein
MRKLLESPAATKALRSWIGSVWVMELTMKNISHRSLLPSFPERIPYESKRSPKVGDQIPEILIVFAWIWDDFVGIVSHSGHISVRRLTDRFTIENDWSLSDDVSCLEFYNLRNQLFIYDKGKKVISCHPDGESEPIVIESHLFGELSGKWLYCPNPEEFWYSNALFCTTESRVVTFATSQTFSMFVFSSADGMIHFRSARKASKIGASIQMNELIDGILITEKWGFIVMHSPQNLYLYTVNGAKLKEVKLKAAIRTWTSFSSVFGFDYVAYADIDGGVVIFEAFYPEKPWIVSHLLDVICLKADESSERLLIVTSNGDLQAIPYAFGHPVEPVPFTYEYK